MPKGAACCLFVLLLFAFSSRAQQTLAENRLKVNKVDVPALKKENAAEGRTTAYLEMPFGRANFLRPSEVAALQGKVIEKVELVYTAFAVSADFNQQGLNKQRVHTLAQQLPGLTENTLVGWQLTAQTSATTADSAKKMFHGFVITYRPDPTPETMATEVEFLKMSVSQATHNKVGGTKPAGGDTRDPSSSTSTHLKLSALQIAMNRIGDNPELSLDTAHCYEVKREEDYTIVKLQYRFMGHKRTRLDTVSNTEVDTTQKLRTLTIEPYPDSIISVVMRRNAHWTNAIIVCDLTGSMAPYTTQLFAWFATVAGEKRIRSFVFFNDGDGKLDRKKEIGHTGGIHRIASNAPDSVFAEAVATMKTGSGGDTQENNVEAMLAALSKADTNVEIILIADNLAVPRDMSLLREVNRPVHVIACGSNYGINPAYLKIARFTHGSLHTLYSDIEGLDQLQDGDVINIGKEHFKVQGYNFFTDGGN